MQNKKMLFFCQDVFDLYKVFQSGFEKYSDCEVTLVLSKNYKYKNNKERILNFIYKFFLGKNIKKIWQTNAYFENLDPNDRFEYTVVICADAFDVTTIERAKRISKKTIAYYWDGFDHFPAYKKTVTLFDKAYTFDPEDAKKYNLNFVTNFYFAEDRNYTPNIDLFFLSSYDSRYPLIEKIVMALELNNPDVKINILQFSKNKEIEIPEPISKAIQFINKPIPITETTAYLKSSKIILDIQKNIQRGLTFRVFEAMGLGKKLITTNADIINYDFYNPNNIFIWSEETTTIPKEFLETPYQELPIEIYEKYSQKKWVQNILN